MRAVKYLCLAAGLAMVASMGVSANAGSYNYRQYYSGWYDYAPKHYYYRYYYYKPTPEYYGYKYNYCLYYPKQYYPQYSNYYYWYNQYNSKYYGRCPYDYGGKPLYSWLAPEDQKATLAAIPDEKFPVPNGKTTPPIPETKPENEGGNPVPTMDLPPGDPPVAAGLPIG